MNARRKQQACATAEAHAMKLRDESSHVCFLQRPHRPHVFTEDDRASSPYIPCGGRWKRVDKEQDRSVWDDTEKADESRAH